MNFLNLFEFKLKTPPLLLKRIQELVLGEWARLRVKELKIIRDDLPHMCNQLKRSWNQLEALLTTLDDDSPTTTYSGELTWHNVNSSFGVTTWTLKHKNQWELRFSDPYKTPYEFSGSIEEILSEFKELKTDTFVSLGDKETLIKNIDNKIQVLRPSDELYKQDRRITLAFSDYDEGFTYPVEVFPNSHRKAKDTLINLRVVNNLDARGYWIRSLNYPTASPIIGEIEIGVSHHLGPNFISNGYSQDTLQSTCKHELQHAIQTMINVAKGIDTGGYPKRKLRNGNRAEHPLRDIEFHTNLTTLLQILVRTLEKAPKKLRKDVFAASMGLEIPNTLNRLYGSFERGLLKDAHSTADYIVGSLKQHAKEKWKAYVSLLYKELIKQGLL